MWAVGGVVFKQQRAAATHLKAVGDAESNQNVHAVEKSIQCPEHVPHMPWRELPPFETAQEARRKPDSHPSLLLLLVTGAFCVPKGAIGKLFKKRLDEFREHAWLLF